MSMEKTFTISKSVQWYLVLFIMLCAFISSAQITISQNDMPRTGWTLVHAIDSTSNFAPGSAGTNQTWDFSSAVGVAFDTVVFSNPSAVPGGSAFPDANLAEGRIITEPEGTLANYLFWNSSPSQYQAVGWTLQFSGEGYNFYSVESYDPNPAVFSLPLNYGNENTVTFTGTRYSSTRVFGFLADSSMVISHLTATSTVDGSGTIITPADSYEVLRIHETSTNVDSSYTWTEPTGWQFDRTETYEIENYRWLANNVGEVANLSIEGTDTYLQFLTEYIIGVPDIQVKPSFTLYPIPAGNLLFINSKDNYSQVEIFDLKGQLVMASGSQKTVNIGRLQRGIYMCRITGENGVSYSKKFVKK